MEPGAFYAVAGPYLNLDVGTLSITGTPLTGFSDWIGVDYLDLSGNCAVFGSAEYGFKDDGEGNWIADTTALPMPGTPAPQPKEGQTR